MTLVVTSVALADNLTDTLAAGSVANPSISEGGTFSTTINYQVQETGGNNTTFPASVSFSLSGAPAWISLSPTSRTFDSYSDVESITVSGTAPTGSAGTHNFTVDASTSAPRLNTSPAQVSMSVTVSASSDSTAPTNASISINGGDAWTNSRNVTLSLAAQDNVGITKYRLSETHAGLATASDVAVTPTTNFTAPSVAFTLSDSDASSKAVWVRFFDAQGNSTDASDTIGLDRTKPVISGSTGTYTQGTWTNQSVSVIFTCADAGSVQSGIATDTVASGNTTFSSDGENQSVNSAGSCIDTAGNAADGISVGNIDIDKTKPTSVVSGFTNGAVYNLGDTLPTVTCSDDDNLSGIASGGTLSGPTGSGTTNPNGVGTFTFSCNGAVDNAGNTQTTGDTKSYTVQYDLTNTRILQPINYDNTSLFNRGKAVPVKFQLSGSNPYDMTGWKLLQQPVSCTSLADEGLVTESVVENPSNTFRYDSSANQYINNANFKDKAVGSCWKAGVQLDSGQIIWSAVFRLQK